MVFVHVFQPGLLGAACLCTTPISLALGLFSHDLNFVEQGLPHGKSYQGNFPYEGHKRFGSPCRTAIWVPLSNFSEVGTRVVCYPSVTSESPWNQYIVKYLHCRKTEPRHPSLSPCYHVSAMSPPFKCHCHCHSPIISSRLQSLVLFSCFWSQERVLIRRSVGIFSLRFLHSPCGISHIFAQSLQPG